MKPEQQLKALANFMGWKHHEATRDNPVVKGGMRLPNYFENRDSVDAWTHPDHEGVYSEPPRYLNSLDAVAQIEAKLSDKPDNGLGGFSCNNPKARYLNRLVGVTGESFPISATAEQRCKALLLTTKTMNGSRCLRVLRWPQNAVLCP